MWPPNLMSDQAEVAVRETRFLKNVHVLLHTSDTCRGLVGMMAVCCKSGKDRTSLAVTLEEGRFLCENYSAVGGRSLCMVLRKHGVRRKNVYINTGQPYYAFNHLQQSMFPACYRAPPGTYSASIKS